VLLEHEYHSIDFLNVQLQGIMAPVVKKRIGIVITVISLTHDVSE